MANVQGSMPLAYQYSVPVQSDAGKVPLVQDQPPMPEIDNPSITSTAHTAMQADWHLCRTVYEGTGAMRNGREKFLPQYERESILAVGTMAYAYSQYRHQNTQHRASGVARPSGEYRL
jgi:hypothetical protein